jgi:hypothetical protein
MGRSCLPAREDPARSSSLLRFLSSRTDECTGNGGPGVMGCTATARQRADFALVFLALRLMPWARVLSWHATATINSSLALGDDGFGPKQLAEPSIASTLGTATTLRSTALARDGGSWKKLAKRQGPCWRALVRAPARLPSVYPLTDCSRSQVFVDEGESECLASSYRGAFVVARR